MISIRQLSAETGVSPRMLRHYEEKGLLSSARKEDRGLRYYEESAIIRVQTITALSFVGFDLGTIVRLMGADAKVLSSAIDEQIYKLDEEIKKTSRKVQILRQVQAENLAELQDIGQAIHRIRSEVQLDSVYKNQTDRAIRRDIYELAGLQDSSRGWCRWILDHMHFPEDVRIAEFDAEEGNIWASAEVPPQRKLPQGTIDSYYMPATQIVPRDFSDEGLVTQWIRYEGMDQISDAYYDVAFDPYVETHGDAAKKWVLHIWEKLKPGGVFYGVCIDDQHMQGLLDWCSMLDPTLEAARDRRAGLFGMDTARKVFEQVGAVVTITPAIEVLHLKDEAALLAHILHRVSYTGSNDAEIHRYEKMKRLLHRYFKEHGEVTVESRHYMLEARKPR